VARLDGLLAQRGLREGFARSGGIYPPGTFLWLYAVIQGAGLFGVGHFLALKLSLAFALVLTSAVLWFWTRDLELAMACFLSLALNAVALGYTDAHFAPPLLLSLLALARGQRAASGALLAAAFPGQVAAADHPAVLRDLAGRRRRPRVRGPRCGASRRSSAAAWQWSRSCSRSSALRCSRRCVMR
jgi:hypothetical protein